MNKSAGTIAILVTLFCAPGCEASKASSTPSPDTAAAGASEASSAGTGDAGSSNTPKAGAGAAGASSGGKPWSEILGTAGGPATECYSPVRPELQPPALAPASTGCACETYDAEPTGPGLGRVYCLNGRAVYCPKDHGRWIVGTDGPCALSLGGPRPLDICTERLGGGAVARGASCPSGFAPSFNFASASDADSDAGTARSTSTTDATVDCCYPIRVTAQNCTQAGFEVQDGESTQDVLKTTCSNGKGVLAFVGESGTKVCCERD